MSSLTATTSCPVFTGEDKDFPLWLLTIEAKLKSSGINLDANASLEDSVEASIFGLLLTSLQGHPLFIVTSDNPTKSGTVAIQRLKERYVPSGQDYKAKLQRDLRTLQWNATDSVDSFMERVSELIQQLHHINVETPMEDTITIIREVLPQDFDLAIRFITMADSLPSLQKLTAKLLEEERLIKRRQSQTSSATALALRYPTPATPAPTDRPSFSSSKSSSSNNQRATCCPPRNSVKCTFCNFTGHCAQECFKLRGAKKHGLINVEDILTELRRFSDSKRNGGRRSHPPSKRAHVFAFDVDTPGDACSWLIDTGANVHVTGNRDILHHYTAAASYPSVTIPDGRSIRVDGMGTAVLNANGTTIILDKVLHIAGVTGNILSGTKVTKLEDSRLIVDSTSTLVIQGLHLPLDITTGGHLFLRADDVIMPGMISSINGNRHNTLGHSALVQCEPCTLAKSSRSSVPKRSAPRTAGPCKLLYCDIAGPLEVLSTRNCRYALAPSWMTTAGQCSTT